MNNSRELSEYGNKTQNCFIAVMTARYFSEAGNPKKVSYPTE